MYACNYNHACNLYLYDSPNLEILSNCSYAILFDFVFINSFKPDVTYHHPIGKEKKEHNHFYTFTFFIISWLSSISVNR